MSFSTHSPTSSAPSSTRSFSPPNPFPSSLHTLAVSLLLAVCWAFLAAAPSLGQADVQIIHNAADPDARIVDIYIEDAGGSVVANLDDVAFRSATGFLSLSAGDYDIIIAGSESTGPGDAVVATFPATLDDGEGYTVVANGVLAPGDFETNPEGRDIAFDLLIATGARSSAASTDGNVEIRVVHGATDAPTVDVLADDGVFVNDATYRDITGYLGAPADDVDLDVTPGNDNNTVVASFDVDLGPFADTPLTVLASGFLSPGNENTDAGDDRPVAPFTLIAVAADGTVIDLGASRAQVIHNAPDPAAQTVDIYIDGALLPALDDFTFRSATPFVDLGSGVRSIAVAPGNSNDVTDAIATFDVVVPIDEELVIIASGVLDPSNFEGNPDSEPIAFELLVEDDVREESDDPNEVQFLVNHGSPDAPTVDVNARGVATLVDDATYRDITDDDDYIGVPAGVYTLDVALSDQSDVAVSFTADLSGLNGASAIVLASGFLTPANDQNGPAFALIAALADGTVVTFPATTFPLILNEVDSDTPSTDDAEFIELYNRSDAATVSLDPYVVVFFNGSDDESYETFDLTGSLLPNGFFTIGDPSVNPDIELGSAQIQNGADAVALYRADASAFPDDTPVTMVGLESAFVYDTDDADDAGLLSGLGQSTQYNEDANGEKDTQSIQRFPDGADNVVIADATPSNENLPVELAGFDALIDGSDVVLTWRTLSETNNSGFEVQKQIGDTFERIGFRAGQGTTNEATAYRFRVRDLSPGTYTFRLKQIDIDGTFAFSPSVDAVVQLEEPYAWTRIAPNPVAQRGALTLQVRETQDVTVDVYDLLGRRVVQLHSGPMTSDRSHTLALDAVALPSGTYFLRARGEAFTATQQLTVVR